MKAVSPRKNHAMEIDQGATPKMNEADSSEGLFFCLGGYVYSIAREKKMSRHILLQPFSDLANR